MSVRYSRLVEWMRQREARRALYRFSDMDLADIGISRSEIDAAVSGRFFTGR